MYTITQSCTQLVGRGAVGQGAVGQGAVGQGAVGQGALCSLAPHRLIEWVLTGWKMNVVY